MGTLAAAAVLGVATMVPSGDGGTTDLELADPTTTTSVPPDATSSTVAADTTTTTERPAARAPQRVVVARETGSEGLDGTEVVILDVATKRVLRTVLRTPVAVTSIDVDPEGRFAYIASESCGPGLLERVRLDGPEDQEPERLNEVASVDPAVSPDGRAVAYVAVRRGCQDDAALERWDLVVLDLTARKERIVTSSTDGTTLSSPSWSPDGSEIAVSVQRPGAVSDDGTSRLEDAWVAVVDAATTGQQLERAPVTPSPPRKGRGFVDPTFAGSRLFAVEVPLGDRRSPAELVVVAAPGSGRAARPDGRTRVALGDAAREYSGTAADASGDHLLYLSRPRGRMAGDLRASFAGAKTTVLASAVTAADW